MEVTLAPPWPCAVFHVLAHVGVGRVPASCHDLGYVAWAEARLGPAAARELGEDARLLAAKLGDHEDLARAQALAWVWRDTEQLARATERSLAELSEADVESAEALLIARTAGAVVEILRAAAELELPDLARLSSPEGAVGEVERALRAIASACPELVGASIDLVPALPRRGRVMGRRVFVGVPGIAGADAEHVAWQAAHEATVRAVADALGPETAFVDLERAAISTLETRARAAGLGVSHARWLAELDLSGLAR